MSKRRRRKYEEVVSESGEKKEKPIEEKPKEEEAKETGGRTIGTKRAFFFTIVIAAVFFGMGFFVNPAITGQVVSVQPSTGSSDMLIFISPPGCTACEQLEPMAKDVANTLGVLFVKTGFGQQIESPGFVLVYNNVLTISGMDSEYTLKMQICDLTKNEEICNEANALKPPEEPEPPTPEFPKRDEPENTDIKTFFDSGANICYEDGKPVIRMYASSRCGYCKWNKPMYEKVAKEYMDQGKIVAYLWEDGKNILSDEQETMPPEEEALRQQYGFTGVPSFIFGCKYYRGGASYSRVENGEALEEEELRNVINDLLGE